MQLAAGIGRLGVTAIPEPVGANHRPDNWSLLRNALLVVQGLGVMFLILRDAIRAGDTPFKWIGVMIGFSYAFYAPVILWSAQAPMLGMLMIPEDVRLDRGCDHRLSGDFPAENERPAEADTSGCVMHVRPAKSRSEEPPGLVLSSPRTGSRAHAVQDTHESASTTTRSSCAKMMVSDFFGFSTTPIGAGFIIPSLSRISSSISILSLSPKMTIQERRWLALAITSSQ